MVTFYTLNTIKFVDSYRKIDLAQIMNDDSINGMQINCPK